MPAVVRTHHALEGSKRYRVWAVSMCLAGTAVLLAGCSRHASDAALPPASSSPFDWSRSPLTEVQFFNEMTGWVDDSHRFPGRQGFAQRQQAFEQMARQGFEPAVAAVALFDFARLESKVDSAAFNRLLRVAEAGDLSAKCALFPLYQWSPKSFQPPDPWAVLRPLLESGANGGHYVCQFYLGYRLAEGRDGFDKDPQRAKDLLTKSALGGFVFAQSRLAHMIGTYRIDDLRAAEEALCWISSTYRHSKREGTDVFANGIYSRALKERERTGSRALLDQVNALIDRWILVRHGTVVRDTDPRECLNFRK